MSARQSALMVIVRQRTWRAAPWKGSQYAAGAGYSVEGGHAFTAVREKNAATDSGSSDKKSPLPATGDGSGPLAAGLAPTALGALNVLWTCEIMRRSYRGLHSR